MWYRLTEFGSPSLNSVRKSSARSAKKYCGELDMISSTETVAASDDRLRLRLNDSEINDAMEERIPGVAVQLVVVTVLKPVLLTEC